MIRPVLALVLLAAACAPYQQMRQSYVPASPFAAPHDQALAECRLLTMQDRRSNDWYAVRAGSPTVAPDGTLIALSEHGMDLMRACMRTKGWEPGPMVPYHG